MTDMTMAFAVAWIQQRILAVNTDTLTEVSPIAHPREDDDALPEVPGDVDHLADEDPHEEPKDLVNRGDEEHGPQRGHIRGVEGRHDVGEYERRERDIHGYDGRPAGCGWWKHVHLDENEAADECSESVKGENKYKVSPMR